MNDIVERLNDSREDFYEGLIGAKTLLSHIDDAIAEIQRLRGAVGVPDLSRLDVDRCDCGPNWCGRIICKGCGNELGVIATQPVAAKGKNEDA